MARCTKNMLEVRHLARVNRELGEAMSGGFLIKVHLADGSDVVGMLGGMNMGNNGGTMMPATAYYGELRLRTIANSVVEIDLLDIQHISNFTSPEGLALFEKAGVIRFVDLPNG